MALSLSFYKRPSQHYNCKTHKSFGWLACFSYCFSLLSRSSCAVFIITWLNLFNSNVTLTLNVNKCQLTWNSIIKVIKKLMQNNFINFYGYTFSQQQQSVNNDRTTACCLKWFNNGSYSISVIFSECTVCLHFTSHTARGKEITKWQHRRTWQAHKLGERMSCC